MERKTTTFTTIIVVLCLMLMLCVAYIIYDKINKVPENSDVVCIKAEKLSEVNLLSNKQIDQIVDAFEKQNNIEVDRNTVILNKITDHIYGISFEYLEKVGAYQVGGYAYKIGGSWNFSHVGSGTVAGTIEKLEESFCK